MMNSIDWLLSWVACSWMTGIILIMHFIHYPHFKLIEKNEFKSFAVTHSHRITFIVFPAMLIELVCSLLLFWNEPNTLSSVNFITVGLLWAITGLKSAKTHEKLQQGYQPEHLTDLLGWNRFRVALWGFRFIFLSWINLTIFLR